MRNKKRNDSAGRSRPSGTSAGGNRKTSSAAYGDKASICINADCMLRKKAGGCLGFEGCPGFKAR